MILELAVLDVRAGSEPAFEAVFVEARPLIASIPGFLGLEPQRCVERPNRYSLMVRWRRPDGTVAEGFSQGSDYYSWVNTFSVSVGDSARATTRGMWNAVKEFAFLAHDAIANNVNIVAGLFGYGRQIEYQSGLVTGFNKAVAEGRVWDFVATAGTSLVTLGLSDVAKGAVNWYKTGDPTQYNEAVGGFAFGLVGGKAANAAAQKVGILPCFPAGTKLRTPDGWKAVEDFRIGDRVVSKPEDDPEAATTVQVVTRTFRRSGKMLELSVNGRAIEATHEHPFWVVGKGWVPAMGLMVGDEFLTSDGWAVVLERVTDLGRWARAVQN